MAIHLLRPSVYPNACEAGLLELAIARLICLSNDLVSFEKESSIGDFHNELIILRSELGDKVQAWASMEIRSVQKRIHLLARGVASQSTACRTWVECLFFAGWRLLGWSDETSRYVSYVNGTLRPN
ncbi:terpene synthase family protein [Algoriphagus boritolerans]|uniref:terpene synthase family protein n=1 Tax=Algoriphagus boritolerans TaxID=308111 RepID=UPI002FCDFFF2